MDLNLLFQSRYHSRWDTGCQELLCEWICRRVERVIENRETSWSELSAEWWTGRIFCCQSGSQCPEPKFDSWIDNMKKISQLLQASCHRLSPTAENTLCLGRKDRQKSLQEDGRKGAIVVSYKTLPHKVKGVMYGMNSLSEINTLVKVQKGPQVCRKGPKPRGFLLWAGTMMFLVASTNIRSCAGFLTR